MAPKPRNISKKHIARLEQERRQIRLIKIIAIAVVAAVILTIGYGILDINYLQARRPVVTVNGAQISAKEFQARVTIQRSQLVNQYIQYLQYQQVFGLDTSAQLEQLKTTLDTPIIVGQQVMDDLVNGALIRQEAERRGISVTAEELEAFTQEQFQYFPAGTPTPTLTPTQVEIVYPTLSAKQLELVTITPEPTVDSTAVPLPSATPALSATPTIDTTPLPTFTPSPTSTPYTLEGYQNEYANALNNILGTGLTEEQYQQLFETEILRQKLFDIITADVPHEEEQVWARHILVADEESARSVIERYKKGEDFGALAAELSQDPGSRASGGDLGWFGRGQMVAPFEEAAFNLDVGELSEPVESSFGWHVIQLLGRTTLPLTSSAYEQARQKTFDDFLAKLREDSDISYSDTWTERIPTSPGLDALQQSTP